MTIGRLDQQQARVLMQTSSTNLQVLPSSCCDNCTARGTSYPGDSSYLNGTSQEATASVLLLLLQPPQQVLMSAPEIAIGVLSTVAVLAVQNTWVCTDLTEEQATLDKDIYGSRVVGKLRSCKKLAGS